MAVLEAQIPVEHRSFVPNTVPGRHGSAQEGSLAEPVTRYVVQVYPANWQSLRPDPINLESLDRNIVDLIVEVPDPEVYKARDTITIRGKSFVVQGQPEFSDFGNGYQMMPEYDDMFGGQVLVRRVNP